jgi:hypothetical protein
VDVGTADTAVGDLDIDVGLLKGLSIELVHVDSINGSNDLTLGSNSPQTILPLAASGSWPNQPENFSGICSVDMMCDVWCFRRGRDRVVNGEEGTTSNREELTIAIY